MNYLNNQNKVLGDRKQRYLFFAVACSTFIFTLVLNRLYPLLADDWAYSFVFKQEPPKMIENISDVFYSQYVHYMTWGGRSIVHFIAQILLYFDPIVHDCLNSLAFVLFLYVIYKIANKGCRINTILFILIVLFTWLSIPSFTNTIFWITGSANYLWGSLIILLFVYPYYSCFRTDDKGNDSWWKSIVFFLFGILAGWTNENMVVGLIFMIAIFCLYYYRNKSLSKWAVCGLIGLLIGCTVMLAAPGNYIRAHVIAEILDTVDKPFFQVIGDRLKSFPKLYEHNMLLPLILFAVSLFTFIKTNENSKEKKKIIFTSVLFFLSAHVAFFAMIAAPAFPGRALFGVVAFMILSIAILIANMQILNKKYFKIGIAIISVALFVVFCIDYSKKYKGLYQMGTTFEKRAEYVKSQKEKGIYDIVFEDSLGKFSLKRRFEFEDLNEDSIHWLNQEYAKYYGIKSVKALPQE